MPSNDFSALEKMIYSGRGITAGLTPSSHPFIGYSLTGRSQSSQARKLIYDEKSGVIRTSVTDLAQLEKGNPALLLYPAVARFEDNLIASNGTQTELILSELRRDTSHRFPEKILRDAFSEKYHKDEIIKDGIDLISYEPDAPNFTPRISACLTSKMAAMYIVKRIDDKKMGYVDPIVLTPGMGRLMTTYKGGNENPLLSFEGNPIYIKIGSDNPEEIIDSIYAAIKGGQNPGDNYRVAAAVMMIKNRKAEVAIRNRSEIGE
ncbi:hypothetical protein HYT56_04195 [Candidatus Woesearchaeota archaeon]|nr:hypothetical protein [Candidatus Woesearchaeota archaeon]